MKLSEELIWRGFNAKTTVKDLAKIDDHPRKFYFGADPSADSLTIGNLASLMMCACFVRHGYTPYLLVGGATGQIGDPKDNGERDLKPLEEVEHNKKAISEQFRRIIKTDDLQLIDNYDWFKDIKYLDFLREVGKSFSMTQLLDRQFVQNRIGEGGSGISYAEFSYTLMQGYDFLHLYRTEGIDLQLCGADQYGNCTSGIHLIRTLENAEADIWAAPLVIDPVTGVKFGKSEGNAIWLDSKKTSIFDFYQFWLNQSDQAVEIMLKFYTTLEKEEIEQILLKHAEHPEQRIAQKALAKNVTEVVHGAENAEAVISLTDSLFNGEELDFGVAEKLLPVVSLGTPVVDALVGSGLSSSKTEARKFLKGNAVSLNGEKITEEINLETSGILKKGKNKFAVIR